MSMKKCNDTIGNPTSDLPACSTVPQPNAPPRAPVFDGSVMNIHVRRVRLARHVTGRDKKNLTHCGRVTQICVFNAVKLGTSASSP